MSRTVDGLKPGRLRISAALAFYVLRLRRRWLQELLAVVGIAAGVALLYASQVASTSMSGPIRELTEGLVGHSQLELSSRGGVAFPEETYNKVIAQPGVARAAPILQLPGNVVGPRGQRDVTFFGADPRVVRLRGTLLQGFSAADAARQQTMAIAAPTAQAIGVHTGDDVRVELAGRSATIPIVVAAREQIGSLVDTSIALAPLAYLQRLARAGPNVTHILVEAESGQVQRVQGGLRRVAAGQPIDVRPVGYEPRLFDKATSSWRQSSAIFGVVSALVGWLFALCALLVSAADRRGLANEQREQGFPASATIGTLLVDAAVVGVLGVALGLGVGEAISRHGFSTDLSFLSAAFAIGDHRVVTWQSIALASLGGLLAATVGVLAPVGGVVLDAMPGGRRRARRPSPESNGRRLHRLGALALLASISTTLAVIISLAAPAAVIVALVLLVIALVSVLPLLLAAVVGALEWCTEHVWTSNAVVLALQQLQSRRWHTRALAIAATGAVAVFGATALQGAESKLQNGLEGVARGLDQTADIWVSATGAGNTFATSRFTPTSTGLIAAVPGVGRVDLYRAGLLDFAGSRALVIGQPSNTTHMLPPGNVRAGALGQATARVRTEGWATMSRAMARELHLEIGERFVLPAPNPISVRLAAITTNFGWPGGSIIINADNFARAWNSNALSAYHVQIAPGASLSEVRSGVVDAIGPRSGLRVETAAERVQHQSAASRSGLARLRQIAQLTLLAAVFAMGAAMIGLLWQHRPIIAEHKMSGLSTGLMWRTLIAETSVLFAVGTLAGAVFGLLGQQLCTRGVEVLTGFPVVDGLRVEIAATTCADVLLASVVVVLAPGFLVARTSPLWDD